MPIGQTVFEQIRDLHHAELYDDVKELVCLILSFMDGLAGTDAGELLTLAQRYQCMIYLGDSFYHTGEYRRAEENFSKCLQIRKNIGKSRTVNAGDLTKEVDVKFKLYQCYMKLRNFPEALSILESVNAKQRTARISLALAKLYGRSGKDRSALTCYKEVSRLHPMALEVLTKMVKLGMDEGEVMASVACFLPPHTADWLKMWLRSHEHLFNKSYNQAITTFRTMEYKFGLKNNVLMLSYLGEAAFHAGHYNHAMAAFKRAHLLDPLFMKNMDLYAYLLGKEKKIDELNTLAQSLSSTSEQPVESWIAMGYCSLYSPITNKNRTVRAIYCAQRAYTLDGRSVQALVLKGSALLDIKKYQQAMQHFHEAIRMAPMRFEAYQGMVDCYLSQDLIKDALNWASRAAQIIGVTARALTLAAYVMARDTRPEITQKAKQYLNRAMTNDPNFLEPVYILADIMMRENDYTGAAEVLRKYLHDHSTARLHQQLADCLTNLNQHQEALDQYSISLSIDPSNVKAREACERVEKNPDISYDVDHEELMNPSDDEPDYSDGTWSETEFSQT